MITGASQADAAVLFVPPKKANLKQASAQADKQENMLFLHFTLGIRQIIVAINKMDDILSTGTKNDMKK